MHGKSILALNKLFKVLSPQIVEDRLTFDQAKRLYEDTYKEQLKYSESEERIEKAFVDCRNQRIKMRREKGLQASIPSQAISTNLEGK